MPESNDDLLSYQKLTWKLFKESFFQPIVYGTFAIGIVAGFADKLGFSVLAFMASAISISYYFLLGKAPRDRIRKQIEDHLQRDKLQYDRENYEHRKELYERLDDRGKTHFKNLIKLEKMIREKIGDLGDQFAVDRVIEISAEVIRESIKSLENRITYRSLLRQFDLRKLKEDLQMTKSKYQNEKDLNLKREYRETITALTDELNSLKQIRAKIEQIEQDNITAQSSIRNTILLLSQPRSADYASRLDQQVAKLRSEVEVAKRVNEELANFQIDHRRLNV